MPFAGVKSDNSMRLPARHLVCFFVLGFCATLAAQEAKQSVSAPAPRPASAPAPAPVFTDSQIIETWGWILAREKDVAGIEISEAELDIFLKGFNAGLKGRPAPYDPQKIYPDVERLGRTRREKLMRATEERNAAEARAFFNELKQNTNVVGLPDGLHYEIVRPGTGPVPKPTQTVNVHFIARLIDGTEFMQMGPYDVVMVTNRSLPFPGWVEGMQKINKGGVIKFYIPPPLPETKAAERGIPPGSTMIFEVELLDLKNTSPEDLADALVPPPPDGEPAPPSGYAERQVIETWGWDIARQTGAAKFGLGADELSRLTKGVAAGIKGQPSPNDLEKIFPDIEKFVRARREKARLAFKQKQHADMEACFAGLKQNTNIVELPSGLRYEIIKPGSGPYPKPGQTVKVNYTGSLLDGRVFDKTQEEEPLDFEVGKPVPGWITPGWNEGIQKINRGGRIKLYLPPALGFGSEVVSGVPADSTLIVEIELLDIKDSLPDEGGRGKK